MMEAGSPGPITLHLPATSANLGPGFDTAGLAMSLYLTIEASLGAPVETVGAWPFTLQVTGRNVDRISRPNNIVYATYCSVLANAGRPVQPLRLTMHNEIPLGMGCGSSAAALLGGVMLANHFGELGWDIFACINEASKREGHPDNVAACGLGYMTVSAVADGRVMAATCGQNLAWKLLLALPVVSLATERARALLPGSYSRVDVVNNVQRTALLVAAFAQGRDELLQVAMQDRLHQPYRMEACPLLPLLLPLAGEGGVLGVALSGAGPGVMLILEEGTDVAAVSARVRDAAGDPELEIAEAGIAAGVLQTSA